MGMNTMTPLKESVLEAYFDYVNNYLTVARFAEHRDLTEEQALALIALGKSIAETNCWRKS